MNPPNVQQTLNNYLQTPVGRFIRTMFWTILILISLGLVLVAFQPIASRVTSFLLALACLLLGVFMGFLFGIPRVLQTNDGSGTSMPAANTSAPTQASTDYRQQVNTNLEQISDWLTKIIVGLGLVNLYKIPELLRDTSELIGGGIALPIDKQTLADTALATIFANALILYFPTLGFLVGYLITRIFLSGVFRHADMGELMTLGGQKVSLADVVKNLVNIVITNLTTDEDKASQTTKMARSPTILPKRILWVDDKPNNNIIERQTLTNEGIDVVPVESTEKALEQLKKNPFDLLITDIGRPGKTGFDETAGIDMIKQLKTNGYNNLRMIVYTSKKGFDLHSELAQQAGADDVAYSPRILMKSIGIVESI